MLDKEVYTRLNISVKIIKEASSSRAEGKEKKNIQVHMDTFPIKFLPHKGNEDNKNIVDH